MQSGAERSAGPAPAVDGLLDQIRNSQGAQPILAALRQATPNLEPIPQTTYTLYREFDTIGVRVNFETAYFGKRDQLARAVFELIMGDQNMLPRVHDLLWSICEETTWVLPPHAADDPDTLAPGGGSISSTWPQTSLTRPPDWIDLFSAETGAALAETAALLAPNLAPEVVERIRQEVERRIVVPYLTFARRFSWLHSAQNWNGVCNGAVGVTFARHATDSTRTASGLGMVREGLGVYLAYAFQPDGGTLEGIRYWNYGLLYFVAFAEWLRAESGGAMDMLADPRLPNIARYPLAMALSTGIFANFGDVEENEALEPGLAQKLAERTGVGDLRQLIVPPGVAYSQPTRAAKLPVVLRSAAWWDGQVRPFPPAAWRDYYLPDCAIVKFVGQTAAERGMALAAKAGFTDDPHGHADVASFILNVDGENLLCDPGAGLYNRAYFSAERYDNVFVSSFGHSVPRIAGQEQAPGPAYGASRRHGGSIEQYNVNGSVKTVVISFAGAYDVPDLTLARRTLQMQADRGAISLQDEFASAGALPEIEEAFVTWLSVAVSGGTAQIQGTRSVLDMAIEEPSGVSFTAVRLEADSLANGKPGVLTRLAAVLPAGTQRFRLRLTATTKD